ncbi:MAG: TIGR03435 family protein [Vicinamibacterales bacterium]
MNSDERALAELVDRDLPWPTQMEFVASRDRVFDQLRATPIHRRAVAPSAAAVRTPMRSWALATAVALVIAAIGGAMVWPRGVRAYAAGDDGLQVTLADDSRVEMRAHSELTVGRASDGLQIDLKKGDIIVTAARQPGAPLYVRTKDMTVVVSGTAFLGNAGEDGSRVGVIEGEVRIRDGRVEKRLRAGEEVTTGAAIAQRPLAEDITWSRNANAHLAILESFRRGMAQTSGPVSPVVPAGERQRGAGPAGPASPAAVEFEEASIRECDPDNLPPAPPGARGGGANSFQMTPGRLYALCMTPAVMVRIAHGFAAMPEGSLSADTRRGRGWRLNQVSGQGANSGIAVRGGPDWARNERYSIEAVAGTEANADTMSGPMFRALLERRFKLRTHIETEEVPVWTVTVAPGGLKVKPMAPDGCYENPVQPGVRTPSPRTLEEVRGGAKPTCGVWALAPSGENAVLMVGGSTLEDFAGRLRSLLGEARVSDKTGLTDRFNFVFEFVRGDQGSIASALEHLGLRLEQTRASREFLVIDSIERPGPN